MVAHKNIVAVIFVIAFCILGYSQYALASKIGVEVTKSSIIGEDESGKRHNIELKFQNPSLLVLTAGETDFYVVADEKMIGKGRLQPFVLPSMGDGTTQGTFVTDSSGLESSVVKITGSTKYNVGFTAIEVPFVYYPTEEQTREFIQ